MSTDMTLIILITWRVYVNYLSDGTVRDAGTDI